MNDSHLRVELVNVLEEDHKAEIYSCRFCDILPGYASYFASAGGTCITIYNINESDQVEVVQAYKDDDDGLLDRKSEIFYTLAWASTLDGHPLVCAGGVRGIIKCIDVCAGIIAPLLIGHGGDVLDLRTHPVNPNLLLSASKDSSVRLWNLDTGVCIAIFAGKEGHREQVVSIHFHPTANCFVSSGMDTAVKIWSLCTPELVSSISLSYLQPRREGNLSFLTQMEQFPVFSTDQVHPNESSSSSINAKNNSDSEVGHSNCIDCVRFVGDLLLTKSTKNIIKLWKPSSQRYKGALTLLREFALPNCEVWFFQLDVYPPLDLFACGNADGRVR